MILETRHLELVAAVAEHGTLTRAAADLHVTQSALSHLLLNLEARLRLQLFHRAGRRLLATPAGLELLETARRALPHLRSAEERLRRMAMGQAGIVRLSTECYTCYHWLPDLVRRVQARVPDIEVQIVTEATRRPLDALLDGRIDVAIVTHERRQLRVRYHFLFEDELVGVVSPRHPLARQAYVKPAELAREHVLAYAAPREDLTLFTDFLTPAGVAPARFSQLELTEAIIEMVKAGMGVAALARWAVAPELEAGTLRAVRLGRHGLVRRWCAAVVRQARQPAHLAEFLQALAGARECVTAHGRRVDAAHLSAASAG